MSNHYTRFDCLNAIDSVAEITVKPPSSKQYEQLRRIDEPSAKTIVTEFDSWSKALTAYQLYAVKQVARRLGESPTLDEYEEHRSDHYPTAEEIKRKFGWVNAKQQLGLELFSGR